MKKIQVFSKTADDLRAIKESSASPMPFNWAEFTENWAFEQLRQVRRQAASLDNLDDNLRSSIEGNYKGAAKISNALTGRESARAIFLNILYLGRPFVAGGSFSGELNRWALRSLFGFNSGIVNSLFDEFEKEVHQYNIEVKKAAIALEIGI